MSTHDLGLHTRIQKHLSLNSVHVTIWAIVAILGLGLAVAKASLAFAPQVAPSSQPQALPPSTAKSDKADTKSVVPFEMLPTNHMLVEARINDKGPYHLIFDLGAPITLLSNRISEAAGVVKPGAPRSFLFGMRRSRSQ